MNTEKRYDMRSIAFYNNKGGVGKTTSVINVAYRLAKDNSVLVIDLDGQANCSRFFTDEPKSGLEKSLTTDAVSPMNARCETRYPNIDIVTATPAINGVISEFCELPYSSELPRTSSPQRISRGTQSTTITFSRICRQRSTR